MTLADSIGNADINSAAGIQYSKLLLTGGIVNADINGSAGITYSKLSLTNGIVNSDINTAAAIPYSKLNLAGGLLNADVNASAAIAWSKLSKTGSLLDDLGDVNISTPATNDVLTWNGTNWVSAAPPGAAGGEANTVTNIGTAGVGVYKQKVGVQFELKKINAGSTKITIFDDAVNNEIDIDAATETVLTNQANTFGAFDQLFPHNRLKIGDSDASHAYTIAGSNLTTNRTVTLPALTTDDTFSMLGTSQTITGAKTFATSTLKIQDSDASNSYTIASSNLAADRTITLPLLTGNDVPVFEAHAQTLTNKILTNPEFTAAHMTGNFKFDTYGAVIQPNMDLFMKSTAADSRTALYLIPNKTGVADTIARCWIPMYNDDDLTNSEIFEFMTNGTDGYLLRSRITGTGRTLRPIKIQIGSTQVLIFNADASISIADASNIALGTTTGTKIGTATTQKIGFFGVTPVVQQTAISSPTADATSCKTAIDAIRTRLTALGLTA